MRAPIGQPVDIRTDGADAPVRQRRALLLVALLLVLLRPLPAATHASDEAAGSHALAVSVAFPDGGLVEGEELCLALFAGDGGELIAPLQTRCMAPGDNGVVFAGLDHGTYRVVVPTPDSPLAGPRYAGQVAVTTIPADSDAAEFGIPVVLSLSAAAAGTTGSVAVTVYGCPPGTNGAGDATAWEDECDSLAGEVPLILSGVGSIENTTVAEVTGREGDAAGRVEFANLPAGAYELGPGLPANVAHEPVVFVRSSIDGGIASPLEPDETLTLRPAEFVAVDVYLVLESEGEGESAADQAPDSPNPADGIVPGIGDPDLDPAPPLGLVGPTVTGGLPTATPDASTAAE